MQVPEKLSLIGGSILLASTLIFTLKSQASQILPKINDASSKIFNHIGDAQKSSDFDSNFKDAKKNGDTTGTWGTAKYYVDKNNNMYVGKGTLQGGLAYLLGEKKASTIKSLSIVQSVQAPQDSTALFSTSNLWGSNGSSLVAIYGLDNVNTSQTTSMTSIFCNDFHLRTLEGINSWDVSNVKSTSFAFMGNSMNNIDLSNWHLDKVNDVSVMFTANDHLKSLNISNFNTMNAHTTGIFGDGEGSGWSFHDVHLSNIALGSNTRINSNTYFPDHWQSGNQTLSSAQMIDGNAHPGTWTRQQ